jgi:hypothetical protein
VFEVVRRPRLPMAQTIKGRARIRTLRRRAGIASARAIESRRWYDPREDYWTLSAECPEWADEMRRVERFRPHQRRWGN